MKKISTLIIHPDDRSTDFLRPIYANVENKTVVTGGIDKQQLTDLIKSHDRVMMMGHGSPHGLFAMGQFIDCHGYIINMNDVELLKQKTDNVYVWCNANQFTNKHGLKGLYSGMFISEVGEAYYCGLPETKKDEVTTSNNHFAETLGKLLSKSDLTNVYSELKTEYGVLAESSKVAEYNHKRLYLA
jgi:hypothetical protein